MRIISARPLPDFRIDLEFESGERGIVDVSSFAGRGVFSIWNEPGIFQKISITDEGALAWPGEIDLCPDALYLRLTGRSPGDVFPALRDRVSHA